MRFFHFLRQLFSNGNLMKLPKSGRLHNLRNPAQKAVLGQLLPRMDISSRAFRSFMINLTYYFSDHKKKTNNACYHQLSPCSCIRVDWFSFVAVNVREISVASCAVILVRNKRRVFRFIVWRVIASASHKIARM